MMKKKNPVWIIALPLAGLLCVCNGNGKVQTTVEGQIITEWASDVPKQISEQLHKGYDLPISASEKQEAEDDCKSMMELIADIYRQADKGKTSNIVLSDETLLSMQNSAAISNLPITTVVSYSDMKNYEEAECFLLNCMEGRSGSIAIYEILSGGGIGRMKFIFDGMDMYVLCMTVVWDQENKPKTVYASYDRLKEWQYTDKGWFCYELCVPEPPEVTEIMDGSHMLRIKPMWEEYRKASEKYVQKVAYQGNNLLCSDWDVNHMEDLDYNGLYEYLYAMKYQEMLCSQQYKDGIPKETFENLIMEYLPVTAAELQNYAAFDKEKQTYKWAPLGCFSYTPVFFGTSVPEVTDIRENGDGTVTLTVDAVCEMVLCDEAVITHELTVQPAEDGSFQYLGNRILNDGIKNIPDYEYRCENRFLSRD